MMMKQDIMAENHDGDYSRFWLPFSSNTDLAYRVTITEAFATKMYSDCKTRLLPSKNEVKYFKAHRSLVTQLISGIATSLTLHRILLLAWLTHPRQKSSYYSILGMFYNNGMYLIAESKCAAF